MHRWDVLKRTNFNLRIVKLCLYFHHQTLVFSQNNMALQTFNVPIQKITEQQRNWWKQLKREMYFNVSPSKWKKWLMCGWVATPGPAAASLASLASTRPSPTFRDIQRVGHDVSCSSQQQKYFLLKIILETKTNLSGLCMKNKYPFIIIVCLNNLEFVSVSCYKSQIFFLYLDVCAFSS